MGFVLYIWKVLQVDRENLTRQYVSKGELYHLPLELYLEEPTGVLGLERQR